MGEGLFSYTNLQMENAEKYIEEALEYLQGEQKNYTKGRTGESR